MERSNAALAGKVAVVTGAGSGIGRAIAELFVEKGATVVVVDWNEESGTAAASDLSAEFRLADVSKPDDVRLTMEATEKRHGRIDILVNNAAVQILGKLADTTEAEWDRMQSVNLKGVFLCSKYGIPAMLRNGGGAIVNIASILGFVGDPDLCAYSAMKGGVIAMTRSTALAYGPVGIRVNAICPGDVDTPMVREYFEKDPDPEAARQRVSQEYALRRIATPWEIAKTAAFLASDDASFITGSIVVVDGGVTAKCY